MFVGLGTALLQSNCFIRDCFTATFIVLCVMHSCSHKTCLTRQCPLPGHRPSVYNSDIQAAVMRTAYSNSNKKLAVDAAECLKTTLERFMTSADDAVADHHVPANRPRYT